MIKKAAEIPIESSPRGVGSVKLKKFLDSETCCGKGRMSAVCTVTSGSALSYHQHEGEFETYYILRGIGKVKDNGEEHILTAGDCHVCYDGSYHGIENVGEDDLEFVAIILNA